MKSLSALAAAAALALAACAPEYAYVPTTNATMVGNRVAADYPIPSDMPHGDVRVASFGIAKLESREQPNSQIRALHIRFTITNNAGREWTFDTRDQRVDIEGYGSSAAAFAWANAGSPLPFIRVPPLGKRVVDLYYPLPQGLQSASKLPSFDIVWRVYATRGYVAQRTTFERVSLEPDYYGGYGGYPYDYGLDYWWGPPYWYNPAFGFVGAVAIPPRFVNPHPVNQGHNMGAPMMHGAAPMGAPHGGAHR